MACGVEERGIWGRGTGRLASPNGLRYPVLHVSLDLKAILNRAQPIKGFVYESVRFSQVLTDTIEVAVVPREGSKPRCSGCDRPCSTYDHLTTRTWTMTPLWIFTMALIYTMRRVECESCGVTVEKVPWATGKHGLCDGFRLFLAHWARNFPGKKSRVFWVLWADVYASIQWVVDYGLKHRTLGNIKSIGVDEICVRVGRVFWVLIYQIDAHNVRLLWVGHDRKGATLRAGLDQLGDGLCRDPLCLLRYVGGLLCAIRERLSGALHILDRFHIRQQLNKAVDDVRKNEARALAEAGLKPQLKKLRWALLKNAKNWSPRERKRMRPIKELGPGLDSSLLVGRVL